MSDTPNDTSSGASPIPPDDGSAPPNKKMGDTALRVASALPLIALIVWLLFWGPRWTYHAFCVLVLGIVSRELLAMGLPGRKGLIAVGTAASVGFGCILIFAPEFAHPGLMGLGLVALGTSIVAPDPIRGSGELPDHSAGTRVAWLLGGPIYASMLIPVDLLRDLPLGGRWVVLAMMLAFLSDTFAYFAGRAFGKHKLYEKLSPKKTIEGAAGGLLGAVGGALVAVFVMELPIPIGDAVLLGAIAGALGQMGDLFESLLKRSAGVKDSGNIMPGHGGMLDRTDALMFTATTTWLYASYILPHRV